jgi:GT2 family glycosyltransferase
MVNPIRIAVGIATAGRRQQLSLTLRQLETQILAPGQILVCPASPDDFDPAVGERLGSSFTLVRGPRGLCAQRNAILRESGSADVIVFFDDDFYPASDYLHIVGRLFAEHPDVVVATGHPRLDGASGPGIPHLRAVEYVESLTACPSAADKLSETYGGYGCNMAIRLAPVRQHAVEFDENLPLYGWLEDIDFSRRLAPYGRIVSTSQLRGAHLGTKSGRTSGRRLGYSQIANPVYLLRRGSLSPTYALRHMARNFFNNAFRCLHAEPWVDRRGRLVGNLVALSDLAVGKLDPRRILTMG